MPKANCTIALSRVLEGVPGFESLPMTWFPKRMMEGFAELPGVSTRTITDDDAACIYGAMFCLSNRAASLSFSVNLDAIGRGPLKIDPRVLRIGAGEGGA